MPAEHPIFTVFGPGNNGSSALFWSIHSDHQAHPSVSLRAHEEQRFNKFHLHSFDSLERVLESFPGRQHRIIYPVRRDVERQVISAFIRYAGKIEKRPHRLGLPSGRWSDWPASAVVSAFGQFVAREQLPQLYADFHRQFLARFGIKPTPLHTLQVFRGGEADVLLISSEAVHQSAAPLAEFTAPARFVSTAEHRTSNDRAVLVKLLQPHVRELLKDHLRALRTEFPAFYGPATPAKGPGFWAQLRSLLQLHLRHAASAR